MSTNRLAFCITSALLATIIGLVLAERAVLIILVILATYASVRLCIIYARREVAALRGEALPQARPAAMIAPPAVVQALPEPRREFGFGAFREVRHD